MGISYTVESSEWDGGTRREVHVEAEFDADYTGGGEPLTPGDANLERILRGRVLGVPNPSSGWTTHTESGYHVRYNREDGVLFVREEIDDGTLAEIDDGTDLSGESVRVIVWGED